MITAKDIKDMVERVDVKLTPKCRYENFQPYEGIYRLGDYGYVAETEYDAAFEGEPEWARDAYMLEGNGVGCGKIARLHNDCGVEALSAYVSERFDDDLMDDVFYTEATEEGQC